MKTPTPRIWISTFVALVFSIGLLAGVVLERLVLHPTEMRTGGPAALDGPSGPEGRGGPGRGGRGGQGRGGRAGGPGGPTFGPPPGEYVATLAREVDLTSAQQAEILKLLEAQEAHLRRMQDDARETFVREQEGLHDRIAEVLTPEQATAFRAWVTRRTGLPRR